MLKLYNTLTRQVEDFKSIHPHKVGMYSCGPTVYDYMHIGNLRTFVLSDILFRVLKFNGYDVKSVQNITDIDDKIVKKALETNETIEGVSKKFTQVFLKDVNRLNIPWKMGEQPRVTEYITQIVIYIKVLMEKGLAYQEADGSVYFDISKFPRYGKLSQIDKRELKSGTRVLSDEYTKENVQDFALWKAVPEGEIGSYKSELGWGRPGWHIECSVMSQETLSDTFDIHVGGVDLIFPHHENEIAQSEGKTGKKFVNYFVHGAHMLVNGQKMSKSLGNFYTLQDVEQKGFNPLALRYLYLQTHYRQEMNFTFGALEAAQKALFRLWEEVSTWDKPKIARLPTPVRSNGGQGCAEFEEKFFEAVNDDLNMPKALAVIWELVKSDYPTSAKAESLLRFDHILGLNLWEVHEKGFTAPAEKIPDSIMKLVKEREQLRKQKRFHLADQIRHKIKKLGYDIEDKKGGETVVKMIIDKQDRFY
ncbi:cysteine--tRNA ligase [Candidatus Shapirobacteria bacterium]|nr:cysteine--tRNA ligase [Candidatus Shapirobacteria bacterium]